MAHVEARPGLGRLLAWVVLVGALAAFAYIGRAAEGDPPEDVLYQYDTAVGSAILYGLVLGGILDQFVDAGEEQGLVPEEWQPDRARQFAANAVVVAGVAPIVEELTYRGLGFSLLLRFGHPAAIVLVGIAFGLGHGLFVALPILIVFGIGLAFLRSRTGSVYPAILLHAAFNGMALALSVTLPDAASG